MIEFILTQYPTRSKPLFERKNRGRPGNTTPTNNFTINGKSYSSDYINYFIKYSSSTSVLDLCINLNHFVPYYCFHYNLSIAGNCRMCLVEIGSSKKPIASCAVDVAAGNLHVRTETFIVKRAREGILEYLLVNHPLDCPICDQGGECDLQDEALVYGNDRGRFYKPSDFKRSLKDFNINPMIKVILTRCIYCTRCVRFNNEIQGDYSLGLLGRGNKSEIGLYSEKDVITELGSTITDLCPVGALTVKPYSFEYRPWDDIYVESIDISDSLCSPVRVYTDSRRIIRILPHYDVELKVSWIHDKARHTIDYNHARRSNYPYYLEGRYEKFQLVKTSWKKLSCLLNNIANSNKVRLRTFIGDCTDLSTMVLSKELALSKGNNYNINIVSHNFKKSSELVDTTFEYNYTFDVKDFMIHDRVILVNINLRLESPVINAKLRQRIIWNRKTKVFFIGSHNNMSYKYTHVGTSTRVLLSLMEGRHYLFNFLARYLGDKASGSNLFIYGSEVKNHLSSVFLRSLSNNLNNLGSSSKVIFLPDKSSSMSAFTISLDNYINRIPIYNNNSTEELLIDYHINSEYPLKPLQKRVEGLSICQTCFGNNNNNIKANFILPSKSYGEAERHMFISNSGISKTTKKFILVSESKDSLDLCKFVHRNLLGRASLGRRRDK